MTAAGRTATVETATNMLSGHCRRQTNIDPLKRTNCVRYISKLEPGGSLNTNESNWLEHNWIVVKCLVGTCPTIDHSSVSCLYKSESQDSLFENAKIKQREWFKASSVMEK